MFPGQIKDRVFRTVACLCSLYPTWLLLNSEVMVALAERLRLHTPTELMSGFNNSKVFMPALVKGTSGDDASDTAAEDEHGSIYLRRATFRGTRPSRR